MAYKKEIIVLSGEKGKGIVKLSGTEGAKSLKGSCSLDFRPSEAKLYILSGETDTAEINGCSAEFKCRVSGENISCVLIDGGNVLFGSNAKNADKKSEIARAKAHAQAEKSLWESNRGDSNFKKEQNDNIFERDGELKGKETETPENAFKKKKENGDANNTDNADNVNNKNNASYTHNPDNENGQFYGNPQDETINRQTGSGANRQNHTKQNLRDSRAEDLSDAEVISLFRDGVQYDGTNFYLAVKPQIDEMFVCYPSEETLNTIVPNSKWVKVDADDSYYVVGLLYDIDAPSFICYGVPAEKRTAPPREIADMCVWLPADLSKTDGKGYWVIYQSAVNGQLVK